MSRRLLAAASLSSAPPLDPAKGMLRSRRFWSLIGTQTLGSLADNALRASTIIVVFAAYVAVAEGGDPDRAFHVPLDFVGQEAGTWVGLCFTLPIFLFSMIAGQVADMVDRHVLLRVVKLVEVGLVACAALSFALGSALGLFAFLFLMGAQSAFLAPTRTSMMPTYFPGRDLVRANGYFNGLGLIAIVVGLGLGGFLVPLENGRLLVSVTLVTASALGVWAAFRTPAAPSPGLARIEWNVFAVGLRLYRQVYRMPGVFWPMIGVGWFWGVGALVLANLPNFNRAVGGTDQDFAAFQVLFAVGTGIGSVAAGIVGARLKQPMTVAGVAIGGTALGTVGIWLAALPLAAREADPAGLLGSPDGAVLALAGMIVLTACFNGAFAVPLLTAVQARASEGERARVLATANMTNGGIATLGGLLVPLLRTLGLDALDIYLAVAVLQAAVLAFMLHRRHAAGPRRLEADDAPAAP